MMDLRTKKTYFVLKNCSWVYLRSLTTKLTFTYKNAKMIIQNRPKNKEIKLISVNFDPPSWK